MKYYDSEEIFLTATSILNEFGDQWRQVSRLDRWRAAREKFSTLSSTEKSKIKAIQGHMLFGWHEITPNECSYVTFMRDPIKRAISHYLFLRRQEDHKVGKSIRENDISVEKFFKSNISAYVNNMQTRMISGDYELNEKSLELAKHNIDNYFEFVGLLESFDESILAMSNILEWSSMPFYNKKRISKGGRICKSANHA